MQKGEWVLLDEMNLASQTVLEGLNAVLDYRGTVYIPELGRSFSRHPDFRVFAAQNPLQQGGGVKDCQNLSLTVSPKSIFKSTLLRILR